MALCFRANVAQPISKMTTDGRPPISTPRASKTSGGWGIELKIAMVNYLGGLTKRSGKVSNLRPFGDRLGGAVYVDLSHIVNVTRSLPPYIEIDLRWPIWGFGQ